MNTVRDEWKQYEKEVLPDDAIDVQRSECCIAFYAGAMSLLRMQMKNRHLSDAAVEALFNSWGAECEAVLKAYMAGAPLPPLAS